MREKLLQFVVQTVRENYATHHKPTNGALLAEQVRAKFNGSPYAEAGFEKLSDVIREASTRGDLVRNPSVKHLEVLPAGVEVNAPPAGHSRSYYVRPDAWRAFAMQHGSQSVYFDRGRETFVIDQPGISREDLTEVSTPADATFKEWIKEFAQTSSVAVPSSVFQSSNSLREFSVWISQQNNLHSADWKRFRAAKVTEAVVTWGKTQGVATDKFLSPTKASCISSDNGDQAMGSATDEAIRIAVLACVRDMTPTEISSLAIPMRLILRHFRPRS